MIVPRGSPPSASDISTSTRAPNRRKTSSRPVRDGFRPTSSISTREPGVAAAATSQNAADEKSPGTTSVRPSSRWLSVDRDRQAVHRRAPAEGGQRAFRVIAGRRRFGHAGRALRVQPRQEHGALDLRAGYVRMMGDATQPRAVDGERAGARRSLRFWRPCARAARSPDAWGGATARRRQSADSKRDGPPRCRRGAASWSLSFRHPAPRTPAAGRRRRGPL